MIDISKIKYEVFLVTPQGERISLSPFLLDLSWEENEGELATRAEAEFRNVKLQNKWLHQWLALNSKVFIYSDWGSGLQEVFRGSIFVWRFRDDSQATVGITAYDDLIYLAKSKDDRFYKAGMTAKGIIQDIARAWNIPLGTVQGPNVKLAKQIFRGDTLADMIFSVLEQAKKLGAGKWIVRSKQGKVDVIKVGSNNTVYCFTQDTNISSIEDQQDIEDLVTRVKIIGAEDKEGRAPVVAKLDGKTQFGILQEIVYQRQYDNLSAAKTAAQEILKERGQPRRQRRVAAPDIPFLRKGDKVKIVAGTLNGYYIISSIAHDATNRTMTVEVEDVG
ncbi:conserved hypothetical protein [Caldicellulosiruptor hydrothermalis 108]|uniref:YqbQ/XkdQ domain-containing protein n=1 Tax=Caldicellulosiruptor hydrothermalis (strain DSM 18901 / VKM B-2411 / 108) TaxID=632292 RepID=E4QE23_CALH1|nr:hypothetical protein [Caldicellulosiruptor hydrothermalis]ADQ06517.1 conserved hypothetical protein [Caldicellulosiruptor hydrothermalis 108]